MLCGADIMTEMKNQNAVRKNVDSNIIIRKKINPVHLWEMLERSTLLILQKNSGLIVRIEEYKQASLSVQKTNYAVRMYRKIGFEIVDENDEEYIMICKL